MHEQMYELPILLYTSPGYDLRPWARSVKAYRSIQKGHSQQEYETSHGSMSNVRWSVDGPDEEGLELSRGGRTTVLDERRRRADDVQSCVQSAR